MISWLVHGDFIITRSYITQTQL